MTAKFELLANIGYATVAAISIMILAFVGAAYPIARLGAFCIGLFCLLMIWVVGGFNVAGLYRQGEKERCWQLGLAPSLLLTMIFLLLCVIGIWMAIAK